MGFSHQRSCSRWDKRETKLACHSHEGSVDVEGTPANFSGLAPKPGPLRLAGCPQFTSAPSGGYRANVSGVALITRGVSCVNVKGGGGQQIVTGDLSAGRNSTPVKDEPITGQPYTFIPSTPDASCCKVIKSRVTFSITIKNRE